MLSTGIPKVTNLDPMNRGLKLIPFGFVLADHRVTNLDPMNRGLKLSTTTVVQRRSIQVTNLDPMNRGLKLIPIHLARDPFRGYKPRPDE